MRNYLLPSFNFQNNYAGHVHRMGVVGDSMNMFQTAQRAHSQVTRGDFQPPGTIPDHNVNSPWTAPYLPPPPSAMPPPVQSGVFPPNGQPPYFPIQSDLGFRCPEKCLGPTSFEPFWSSFIHTKSSYSASKC
ncbi:hypothetical protein EYR41_000381 [Orbilia oligospora]|uniref:Uncharacterized protein n=1 Tax=Orbilia oligospora TaxID=2813651 RepID=A0A8H2E9N6_ORBOL|nr:hypothetical protein EYR41_000381 [Orbilia oligospora]